MTLQEERDVTFGKGAHVIYMDDLELYEALDHELSLNYVLERKVWRAVETGYPFERVRDLFSL